MDFHLTYAGILLVGFHFKVQPSTIHIFNECGMQRHCIAFDDAWTGMKMWPN